MNMTDIKRRIRDRFAQPSKFEEGFGHVVVWYDPTGEFEDLLSELDLSDLEPPVELVVEQPDRLFELKCLLNGDLAGRRILLYYRHSRRQIEGDWLADVTTYAEPFEADRAALVMDEMGAADTREMAQAVEEYLPFLSKKTNMRRTKELRGSYVAPEQLHLAVMAVALGKGVAAEPTQVLARYLERCQVEGAADAAVADLEKAGCWERFASLVGAMTRYTGDAADGEALLRHVLLTAFVSSAGAIRLSGLTGYADTDAARQACQSAVLWWYGNGDREALLQACRAAERDCGVQAALEGCSLAELASMDVMPCVNETILHALMTREDGDAAGDGALEVLRQRSGFMWHEPYSTYFDAAERFAQMQAFYRAHEGGFRASSARSIWDGYTGDWCAMDTLYRRFCVARLRAVTEGGFEELEDDLRALAGRAEWLYKGWFVPTLDEAWVEVAGESLREAGYVRDQQIPRQFEFFMTEGSKFTDGSRRLVVIVSDALRYEVAMELAERIEQRTKGSCERASMQSCFPSVTSFGMAALLPHRTMQVSTGGGGELDVLVDGMPTRDTSQRERALQARVPTARALRYDEVADMGKGDLKALLDEAGVLFVYHNAIDAIGDKPETERRVFDACADAVSELASLVERLAGILRRSDEIIVTADHGFLYTYEPIDTTETVGIYAVEGDVSCSSRRYAIAYKPATSRELLEVAMPYGGAEGLVGFSPRAGIRLRQPGAGQNYVHGGASLQEICVPLIRYRKPAGSEAQLAAVPQMQVVSFAPTITSSMFTVTLLQSEPVGGKVVPGSYELVVLDEQGAPVSAPVAIAADREDAEPAARQFKAHVTLLSPPGGSWDSSAVYRLVLRDAGTGVEALSEPCRIQIAFVADDFGW